MLEIGFTGTGDAAQIPVWGCRCTVCVRAKNITTFKRKPAGLSITSPNGITLIDAGRTDLADCYSVEKIARIILTHFHMDHVQGLFNLRWSEYDRKIPVYRPDDPIGCDDLYKHPGIFEFQKPFRELDTIDWDDFTLTALPLNHSKPTLGYVLEYGGNRLAYICDTSGLPVVTKDFLKNKHLDYLILDCAEPPSSNIIYNHNDLNSALEIVQQLTPTKTWLTHISHRFELWLLHNPNTLPDNIQIAQDGMRFHLLANKTYEQL
jgi:phosphoribosyl 1,2-cyclic phosphate phosphodiesterase